MFGADGKPLAVDSPDYFPEVILPSPVPTSPFLTYNYYHIILFLIVIIFGAMTVRRLPVGSDVRVKSGSPARAAAKCIQVDDLHGFLLIL